MNESTHRSDQLRNAVDDLVCLENLYVATRTLYQLLRDVPEFYHHRNIEILMAELAKRGAIIRDLREEAIRAWLEGSPMDLSKYDIPGV